MSAHRVAFQSLGEYLDALRRERQLIEITAEVDPKLELAEIHRRVIEQGGPALLFRRVKGSNIPVATNLFGTKERVDLAFGDLPKQLIRDAARLPVDLVPPTLPKLWKKRGLLMQLLRVGQRTVTDAPVLARTASPPQLDQLPVITTWKEDGGPFFTLPLVYTEHPDTHIPNLGMYRMQRFSANETGMHMQIGKGGGFHLARAKEKGSRLPVNVFLGGPPAAILSAIAPLPENVPELLLLSLALGKRLPLAKTPLSPLPLLAEAEFTLIGEVDPEERRPEGPFGDHYGYYSLTHPFPVFRCKAVVHRENPIYPATVVGKPRQEDYFIGNYLQELLSPLFPVAMPSVRDLWSYGETGYHSLAAAVVHERYKREAMMSAFRILGEGQLSLTKFLLLTDRPMDLKNFRAVLEHILSRADMRTDLYVFSNLSMDTLDYTGPTLNEGSKGVLIGIGDERNSLVREFLGELPAGITKAAVFCGGCLNVSGTPFKDDPELGERIAAHPAFGKFQLVILCDDAEAAAKNDPAFLWTVFTRFEPAADIKARASSHARFHQILEPPIVIDARMKPNYPDELFCDPETDTLVSGRWKEYFPQGVR